MEESVDNREFIFTGEGSVTCFVPYLEISHVRTETTVPYLKMPDWTSSPREPLTQKAL